MNLIALFNILSTPETKNKILNSIKIPGFPNCRIAIDHNSFPVLLFSIKNEFYNNALKNFRLKYLQLEHNVKCKIIDEGRVSLQIFTVLCFTSNDQNLQDYFLKISETLINSLGLKPSQSELIETMNQFIEVFSLLSLSPSTTVQGLWAELFLILNSKNPESLLYYWHNLPEEKFDFNSGKEVIEVKSSSNFERIHTFSAKQLNPPVKTNVIIASLFMKQSNKGQSIRELVELIINKIHDNNELSQKLNIVICKLLGNTLEQSLNIKYDSQIAKNFLQFYHCNEISKIKEIHIPSEVSEVKYKSDLSKINPLDILILKDKETLFNSL